MATSKTPVSIVKKKVKKPNKVTAFRQQLFVEEYLVDLNAKQAAIRAGYSPRTAQSQGSRLLTNVEVLREIDKAKAERLERTKTDADWVLNRLVEEAEADIADLYDEETNSIKPVHEWPAIWRKGLMVGVDVTTFGEDDYGQVTKLRIPDKIKRIELIGKHFSVKAFEDVTRIEAGTSIVEAMAAARERAKSLRR